MNSPDISMEMSPTIGEITKAFISAKGNMGPLIKGAANPFFKSKYADLESVIDVSEQALLDQGIATIQAPGGDGTHVSVTTLFAHASGEWLKATIVFGVTVTETTATEGTKVVKTVKHDPQAAGSVISYLRRYSLQAMCNLAAEDDDGNHGADKGPKPQPRAAVQPPAAPQARPLTAAPTPIPGLRALVAEVYHFLDYDPQSKDDAVHASALSDVAQSLNKLPVPTKWSEFTADELQRFLKSQSDLATSAIVNRFKMTDKQRGHLHAMEGELGIKGDDRYASYSKLCRRNVTSSSDLNKDEFDAVIKAYSSLVDTLGAAEAAL